MHPNQPQHHSTPIMTTLHITVGDREQLRKDTLQFVQAGEADELDENDEMQVLQFGSYEDFVKSVTPLRLELIQAIAEDSPQSMREASRLVDRDVSDVHSDLKQLEVLGILTFEDGGPGGAMQPIVPFDRIEMHIDYPLVEDLDTDGTQASA
jgi:predicted transcriptional regulator